MKKVVCLLTAGVILITALFSVAVSSADEWGRPDVYRSPEYPQSYGGTGTNIERNTLAKDIVLSLRADKSDYESGAVTFTVSLANKGGAVEATALGITPAYNVNVFDPDADAVGEGWGSLNARILWTPSNGWYNDPFVALDTRWDARNRMYFMVAAWDRSAVLHIPAMSEASDFFEFSLVPKNASAGPSVVYVYVQLRNGSDEFARLLSVKVGEGKPAIKSAGITIEENFTVNVSASVPETFGTPRMRFQKEGRSAVEVPGHKEGSLWKFSFPGIFAQCMGDPLSMELLAADGTVLDSRNGFTIRDYAQKLEAADPGNEALVKVLHAMLHFGAEAQRYRSYKVDKLVSEGVPAVPTAARPSGNYAFDQKDPAYQIISAVLQIDNAFVMKIRVEAASEPRISIGNGAAIGFSAVPEDGKISFYTEKLTLMELGKTITVVNGGNTLRYSIVTYLSRNWDSADAGDIIKALYTFFLAAEEYAAS
ncbi:MAG: hypothetical protein IKX06_02715 [Clostridia bacterium]|nr:hypothetical protein [Clostridia bacterium]